MAAPTYTYSSDPTASDLDAVRHYVGDVDADDWQLSDEEIQAELAAAATVKLAAASCCDRIAARYARKVTKSTQAANGIVQTLQLSELLNHYVALAERLRSDGELSAASPIAGGISIDVKDAVEADDDRVAPAFGPADQFDNETT